MAEKRRKKAKTRAGRRREGKSERKKEKKSDFGFSHHSRGEISFEGSLSEREFEIRERASER